MTKLHSASTNSCQQGSERVCHGRTRAYEPTRKPSCLKGRYRGNRSAPRPSQRLRLEGTRLTGQLMRHLVFMDPLSPYRSSGTEKRGGTLRGSCSRPIAGFIAIGHCGTGVACLPGLAAVALAFSVFGFLFCSWGAALFISATSAADDANVLF